MLPTKTNGNVPAKQGKGVFARALTRFRTVKEERVDEMTRAARFGFLIDATASRAETWRRRKRFKDACSHLLQALA